jgi:hypothetical protein
MHRFAILALCAAPLAVNPALAAGQLPNPKMASGTGEPSGSGLSFALGLGGGVSRLSCPICVREGRNGLSGYVRPGLAVAPSLAVGIEGAGWAKRGDEVDHFLTSLSAVLLYYPRPASGLHFKAGPGLLFYKAWDEGNEAHTKTYGVELGVGYDLRIRPGYSVTPFLNLFATSFGSLRTEDDRRISDQVGISMIQLGLGLTLH